MLAISSIIEQKIKQNPWVAQGLAEEIINISQLARVWHAEIEAKTKKEITIEALSMVIRRVLPKINNPPLITNQSLKHLQISVKDNLAERTYVNSDTLRKHYKATSEIISGQKYGFIIHTTGVFETTIIVDEANVATVELVCKDEKLKTKIDNLSAITLFFPEEVIDTYGSYYTILGKLAWQGINLIEVVSTAHELTLITNESDIEPSLRALKS